MLKSIFYVFPYWNSDDESHIFEPERSFFGVFNTFGNQWRVKNDANILKSAFSLLIFPKSGILETHALKKIQVLTLT